MGTNNNNLISAKNVKDDEFYTRLEDIEYEMQVVLRSHPRIFEGKTVLCPCDNFAWSNFPRYFYEHFEELGLKRLISTCCAIESCTYKFSPNQLRLFFKEEKKGLITEVYLEDGQKVVKTFSLKDNGDFRTKEISKYRDQADFIITNPPFSLLQEFVNWAFRSKNPNTRFLIVGPMMATCYKTILPRLINETMFIGEGYLLQKAVFTHGDSTKELGNICWLGNLKYQTNKKELELVTLAENEAERGVYEKLDQTYKGQEVLYVPCLRAIPSDYEGVMNIPLTLFNYNIDKFKIYASNSEVTSPTRDCTVNGEQIFKGLLCQWK